MRVWPMSSDRGEADLAGKKRYSKPTLTLYGSIGELTRGQNGSNPDFGQMAPVKMGVG